MTEEVKRVVAGLREDLEWARANEWETPITLGDHLEEAADLIESLFEELEQVKRERDGLNILLMQAQSMLDTRTRERDAAVEDIDRWCGTCAHSYLNDKSIDQCKFAGDKCVKRSYWQWRGVKEE